jgi:DNA invertase Pin-like site-specific DNA recombinase
VESLGRSRWLTALKAQRFYKNADFAPVLRYFLLTGRQRHIVALIQFVLNPLEEAIYALQPGDTVITPKLDRMFRSASDALANLDAMKHKCVSLHMIDLGGDVTGNGIAKLVFTILSAVAEAERDRIKERVAVVKADQKTRNRFLGGDAPFGFRIEAEYDAAGSARAVALSGTRTSRRQSPRCARCIGMARACGLSPTPCKRAGTRSATSGLNKRSTGSRTNPRRQHGATWRAKEASSSHPPGGRSRTPCAPLDLF